MELNPQNQSDEPNPAPHAVVVPKHENKIKRGHAKACAASLTSSQEIDSIIDWPSEKSDDSLISKGEGAMWDDLPNEIEPLKCWNGSSQTLDLDQKVHGTRT